MRLLLLNNLENVLYIEKIDERYCKLYYQDKHIEIHNIDVLKGFKDLYRTNALKSKSKQYHCPISIGSYVFSPTKNIKDKDCEFFNLLKVDEQDPYYYSILEKKNLLEVSKRRFLTHKENVLFNKYEKS